MGTRRITAMGRGRTSRLTLVNALALVTVEAHPNQRACAAELREYFRTAAILRFWGHLARGQASQSMPAPDPDSDMGLIEILQCSRPQASRLHHGRRLDELRNQHCGCLSPEWRLRRSDLEWGQAGRPAGRSIDQVRARNQSQDGKDARH